MVAGLQTASAQGFRVYKSDGTFAQFSFRTDSIVFYEGAGEDVDFGPFTPVNQCIVGTWYKSKSETVTFNNDGTTNYIEGATYEFLPYQGIVIFYNASGAPVNILKVYKVTADKLIVSTTGDNKFRVWGTTPQPQPVEEIVLSETSLTLQPDERATLTAIVLPENADNKTVTWESSNEDIAEMNRSGRVTANADGSCIITCRATDGSGVYAECQVTVGGDIVVPEEHEWVDLGLPSGTLWATCNVGAENPEEYGDYFAWGETTGYNDGKTTFNWNTYKYYDTTHETLTKYCTVSEDGIVDNKTELEPQDDAATANWGSGWQMPSKSQIDELINSSYTTTTWTTLKGVNGRMIVSNSKGTRIFLPAAGTRFGASLFSDGSFGLIWSRTGESRYAGGLEFNSSQIDLTGNARRLGQSVRPVRVQTNDHNYVTSINLNESSLTIIPGETKKLTATVLPVNADNKVVTWKSSNESVATVQSNGTVTGKAQGNCVIKCCATDGSGVYAECQVTVEGEVDNTHGITDGHEWVDLGLPSGTLWATCNVGANSPEVGGNYYAWGETSPKSTYTWSNYKYCKGSENTLTKYCRKSSYGYNGFTDGKSELEQTDDAASVNWSTSWQMPSIEQFKELIDNSYTTMESVQVNNSKAIKITSKTNSNSILLPTDYNELDYVLGLYWPRSLRPNEDDSGNDNYSQGFILEWGDRWPVVFADEDRYRGYHVRPVRVQTQ